jgi:transcription antitermination factor NusG
MIETSLLRTYPDRRWCALHTRARHEKKIERACGLLGVPSYLPLRIHRTFSGGTTHTFHLPMFPGYVFAALAPGEAGELKRTGSVAQRIETADEAALLRDLINVLAVERARVEASQPRRLEAGQQVVVTAGPLCGVTGVVVRHKNRSRLLVVVGAIGQGILVNVAEADLLPVTESPR